MVLEKIGLLVTIVLMGLGCLYFIRLDWKKYGSFIYH